MRKLLQFLFILVLGGFCCACVNSFAVHELNEKAFKLMEEGNYPAAIARYEASVDLDGEVYESRYNLASALHIAHRCPEAIPHAQAAVKLRPKEPIAYHVLGTVATCAADDGVLTKKENRIDVPIKFDSDIKRQHAIKQYVEYLNIANAAYEQYLNLVPNSEDASQVFDMVNINKEKIKKATQEPPKKPVKVYNY
ncbi:tetratricopeptide repeat protein [bacterium]|nr:tetratricopeptide repeat protein [bacterium]